MSWTYADSVGPDQLTESFATSECLNGEQIPGRYFTHAQYDPNLRTLRMFEGTFSLDVVHI